MPRNNVKHDMYGTPLYLAWKRMKDRCKRNPHYIKNHITIDDHWKDFSNFMYDMKGSFHESLSLDRIDNNEGYSKDNCRWVTMKIQQRNKTNVKFYTYQNKTMILEDWAIELNIKRSTLSKRIHTYKWPLEEVFSIEPNLNNRNIRSENLEEPK